MRRLTRPGAPSAPPPRDAPRATADAGEVVYLLHFSAPYAHARHYLGTTRDLDGRLAEHAAGRGARLVAVALAAGRTFAVARLWRGGRYLERALKRCGGSTRFCPVCTPGTTWGALTQLPEPVLMPMPSHAPAFNLSHVAAGYVATMARSLTGWLDELPPDVAEYALREIAAARGFVLQRAEAGVRPRGRRALPAGGA